MILPSYVNHLSSFELQPTRIREAENKQIYLSLENIFPFLSSVTREKKSFIFLFYLFLFFLLPFQINFSSICHHIIFYTDNSRIFLPNSLSSFFSFLSFPFSLFNFLELYSPSSSMGWIRSRGGCKIRDQDTVTIPNI